VRWGALLCVFEAILGSYKLVPAKIDRAVFFHYNTTHGLDRFFADSFKVRQFKDVFIYCGQ